MPRTFFDCRVIASMFLFLPVLMQLVNNITTFALIKIDGKEIYLEKDLAIPEAKHDNNIIQVFTGREYKIILNVHKTKTYDEGGYYKGTIQIIKGNETSEFKVHGELGC